MDRESPPDLPVDDHNPDSRGHPRPDGDIQQRSRPNWQLDSPNAPYPGRTTIGEEQPRAGSIRCSFRFLEHVGPIGRCVAGRGRTPHIPNQLLQNFPNPFNPSTQISFTLAEKSEVKVDLYDLRGRKVETLFEGVAPKGATSFMFQPRNLGSGAYVILMRAGTFRSTQRIMLLK